MNRNNLFPTLKNYDKSNIKGDLISGIIVAAVSIPISMGYSQIAGLPAVYGLYGSVLPIMIFSVFSTSPQMIWGVDAAPAALVGAALTSAGITAESNEAVSLVPILTLFTALWLIVLWLLKAGRMVKYISEAVMGGFISGIAVHVILMQIPKLLGGTSGSGEAVELIEHIFKTCIDINFPSLLLGGGTLAVILAGKKVMPKFPMAVVMMVAGALSEMLFHISRFGVTLLPAVEGGLPELHLFDIRIEELTMYLGTSLPIAIVIVAETLLASGNFASKNDYEIDENREVLVYGLGTLASAVIGCCPVNGSVSRTVMAEQFGGKSQLTSLTAGGAMLMLLLFGTGFIGYLPVPVLTAIVISALMGVIESDLAVKLYKVDKTEFKIFMGAFSGVLLLGTIYGVIIGVGLSFLDVLIKAITPPRDFMGIIPGQRGFFSLDRNSNVRPIKNVVIYRFSGSLFFANVSTFKKEIQETVTDDTKVVIVDAAGITSVDMTAAEMLLKMYKEFKKRKINFYLTGHIGKINDQLRQYGCEEMFHQGAVKTMIALALSDAGIYRPYKTDGNIHMVDFFRPFSSYVVNEFEWLYGDDADEEMERHISEIIHHAKPADNVENALDNALHGDSEWEHLDSTQVEDVLNHLTSHLSELAGGLNVSESDLRRVLNTKRHNLESRLEQQNPELFQIIRQRREKLFEEISSRKRQ